MASQNTADPPLKPIDSALWSWAEHELGAGYSVEKIDTSQIQITQGGLYYEGKNDWFTTTSLNKEIYNNDEAIPIAWKYVENIHFISYATWKMTKILESKYLPRSDVVLQYPCAELGKQPLTGCIEDFINSPEKTIEIAQDYAFNEPVNVDPYTTTEALIQMRTCCLKEVPFKVVLIFSGKVIVIGHKKRKHKTKIEVKGDIASALRKAPGFSVVEEMPGEPPSMAYTMEGTCSGEAVVSIQPIFQELQTLV